MCGPLSLLLPGDKSKRIQYLIGRTIYNSGRILTYGVLGLLVGLMGEQAGFLIPQKIIFLTLGSLILIYLLLPQKFKNRLNLSPAVSKINSFIRKSFGRLYQKKGQFSQLVFGILNGLIPCGLVYAALSASFLTADIKDGVLYMIFFGLGTFPMMMSFGFIGSLIPQKIMAHPKLMYNLIYFFLAIFMLYKGLTTPADFYKNSHEMTICTGD